MNCRRRFVRVDGPGNAFNGMGTRERDLWDGVSQLGISQLKD